MESLLRYIWQQRIHTRLTFAPGRYLEVLYPGILNEDSGPDFLNARFSVDGRVWTGSVAIHRLSSDWYRCGHHQDAAYNHVILYLVMEDDGRVQRADGRTLTPVVLPVSDELRARYEVLNGNAPESSIEPSPKSDSSPIEITCTEFLSDVPQQTMNQWKVELVTERLMQKFDRVRDLIGDTLESWEEAFYVLLSRSFGTGANSDAFERLARSLPYSCLMEVVNHPLKMQALMLGQAGLLDEQDSSQDDRCAVLRREYDALRERFKLTPLPPSIWKYGRVRPQAAPPIRIATLAALISERPDLFTCVQKACGLKELSMLLQVPVRKEQAQDDLPFYMGRSTIHSLIINAVLPFVMAYGQATKSREVRLRALDFLKMLPAEQNHFVNHYKALGWPAENAYDTQAILQLYFKYCGQHKCLDCRIGCWAMRR